MAILSLIKNNVTPGPKRSRSTDLYMALVDADPSVDGVDLPVGSFVIWVNNGVGIKYFKTGDDPTDWNEDPAGPAAGQDTTAFHTNVAGEISALDSKANPVAADTILLEDSEDSDNKKSVQAIDIASLATLAISLGAGNTTGGNDIVITDGDNIYSSLNAAPDATNSFVMGTGNTFSTYHKNIGVFGDNNTFGYAYYTVNGQADPTPHSSGRNLPERTLVVGHNNTLGTGLGWGINARGDEYSGGMSIVAGHNNIVNGYASIVVGESNHLTDGLSLIVGEDNVADFKSIVGGQGNIGLSSRKFIFGSGNWSNASQGIVFGTDNVADGNTGLVGGVYNYTGTAGNYGNLAMGYRSKATGGPTPAWAVGNALGANNPQQVLTATSIAEGETVTISGFISSRTYTFKNPFVDASNNIDASGTLAQTLSNLAAAINNDVGEGTAYGTGTLVNLDVTATSGATTLTITAQKQAGAGAINLSETCANASWGAATMTGDTHFCIASGEGSFLFGKKTAGGTHTVAGAFSTSFGTDNYIRSNSTYNFVAGYYHDVGSASYAAKYNAVFGKNQTVGNLEVSDGNAVFGRNHTVNDDFCIVAGTGNTVACSGGAVFGSNNTVEDISQQGIAAGYNNTVGGNKAGAFGSGNESDGNGGFCFGYSNTIVSGNNHFAAGYNNTITTGYECAAFGYGNSISGATSGFAFGKNHNVTANYGIAFGNDATSSIEGHIVQRNNSATGTRTQAGTIHQSITTTSGTIAYMAPALVIPNNTTWGFRALVSARRTGGASGDGAVGDSAVFEITGLFENTSGTASLVATTSTLLHNDTGAASWTAVASQNGTTLRFGMTGQADKNITWSSMLEIVESD